MPDIIEQLRRQLIKLGCPIAQIRRLVREVADHHEDLKQAELAEGLSEADAEARANAQLGDPLVLAEQIMTTVRHSSWWGRHYVATFAVLPLLVFPVLWLLFLVLELLLVFTLGFGWDSNKIHAVINNPVTVHYWLMACHFMDYLAIAVATLLFCWLARRSAVKPRWMAISCAICSLVAVIAWARFEPHSISVGFSLNSHLDLPWIRVAIPLLVACATYVFQRQAARRFQEKVTV